MSARDQKVNWKTNLPIIAAAFAVGVILPLARGSIREQFIDKGPMWSVGVPLASGLSFAMIASIMAVIELIQQIQPKGKRRLALAGFCCLLFPFVLFLMFAGMELLDP